MRCASPRWRCQILGRRKLEKDANQGNHAKTHDQQRNQRFDQGNATGLDGAEWEADAEPEITSACHTIPRNADKAAYFVP